MPCVSNAYRILECYQLWLENEMNERVSCRTCRSVLNGMCVHPKSLRFNQMVDRHRGWCVRFEHRMHGVADFLNS